MHIYLIYNKLCQRDPAAGGAGQLADIVRYARRGHQDNQQTSQRYRARDYPQDRAHTRLHHLGVRYDRHQNNNRSVVYCCFEERSSKQQQTLLVYMAKYSLAGYYSNIYILSTRIYVSK